MKWLLQDFGQYVEVAPLTDYREHNAGDECWCGPDVERRPNNRPLISHHQVSDLVTTSPDTNSSSSNPQESDNG